MILKFLSYIVGKLAYMRQPRPLVRAVIHWYVRFYKVDLGEATREIDSYESLGDLFTRDLKGNCRLISGALCSPVDGTLREQGAITGGSLYLVKGHAYTTRSLLNNEKYECKFKDGSFFNFYLSPKDYHHIHSPVSGKIIGWEHIPGSLWPVNSWALKHVRNLFAVNERVVTYIESDEYGLVAVVMVGALNVGSIKLTYDSVRTNMNPFKSAGSGRSYDTPLPVVAGTRIGTFRMGSAVVLLIQKGVGKLSDLGEVSRGVRFGEALSPLLKVKGESTALPLF